MSGGVAKTSLFLRLHKKRRRERYVVRDDVVRVFITDSENQDQTLAAEQAYSKPISTFRTFDFHSDAGYNGITTTKEVPNMTKVKRLTLDRYEHGLMVRA